VVNSVSLEQLCADERIICGLHEIQTSPEPHGPTSSAFVGNHITHFSRGSSCKVPGKIVGFYLLRWKVFLSTLFLTLWFLAPSFILYLSWRRFRFSQPTLQFESQKYQHLTANCNLGDEDAIKDVYRDHNGDFYTRGSSCAQQWQRL